jgi:hypothetical protein
VAETLLDRHLDVPGRFGRAIDDHRIPDPREQTVERNARPAGVVERPPVRDQRLQGGGHIGIARLLAASQRTRVSAQKRQMLGNGLRCGHENPPV